LEALQILDRVSDVLHYQAVTVTGYPTVICKLERTRAMVESIAKIETRHIVGEFRVKVHQ
jgi:hypothetical protein